MLKALDVALGRKGEILLVPDLGEVLLPAFQLLVDRLQAFELRHRVGKLPCRLAVDPVRHADPQGIEAGEDVELRDREIGEPVHIGRVASGHAVEPTAATRPPGGGAVLLALVAQPLAGLVQQFRGEGPLADAGGIGLNDADDAHNVLGAEPDAVAGARGERGRAGDVGEGPMVEVEHGALGALADDLPIVGQGFYQAPIHVPDWFKAEDDPAATYSFGAQVAVVEVDPDTGKIKLTEMVNAHDVGIMINPMAVEGQVHGGVAQGIGYALGEELLYINGRLQNQTFVDYRLPTTMDVPSITTKIVETVDPEGPFGAKGVGEPAAAATAPAIANAIFDAVGIRIKELPITAEKVLKALKEKKSAP